MGRRADDSSNIALFPLSWRLEDERLVRYNTRCRPATGKTDAVRRSEPAMERAM